MKTYFFLIFSIFFMPTLGMETYTGGIGPDLKIKKEQRMKKARRIIDKYGLITDHIPDRICEHIHENMTKKHSWQISDSEVNSENYEYYTESEIKNNPLDSTIKPKLLTKSSLNNKNLFSFGIFATFICLIGYKILSESKKLPSLNSFRKLFNTFKTR